MDYKRAGAQDFQTHTTFFVGYVDYTIAALDTDKTDDFHTNINKHNSHIKFTNDVEKGKCPFSRHLVKHGSQNYELELVKTNTHRLSTRPIIVVTNLQLNDNSNDTLYHQ